MPRPGGGPTVVFAVAPEPRCAVTRAALAASTVALLNRGNRRNPDVLLVEHGRRAARGEGLRAARRARARHARPLIAAREVARLQQLAGHPAVPRLPRLDRPARLRARVPPRPTHVAQLAGRVPPDFVARLEAAFAEMHRARRRPPRPPPSEQRPRRRGREPRADRLRLGGLLPARKRSARAGCCRCSRASTAAHSRSGGCAVEGPAPALAQASGRTRPAPATARARASGARRGASRPT